MGRNLMNTVVYYPHICPPLEWLKLGVLCWDKVYRLVPPQYKDPDTIQALDAACGGVLASVDIRHIADNPQVEEQFVKWVEARIENFKAGEWTSEEHKVLSTVLPVGKMGTKGFIQEFLKERSLARIERTPFEVQVAEWEKDRYFEKKQANASPFAPIPEPGSAYEQYCQLIDDASQEWARGHKELAQAKQALAREFRQQHLITIIDHSEVIYLPKDIAFYYLSLCASKVALDGKRDLAANGGPFTDVVFHDFRTIQGEVAVSVLQAYLPNNFLAIDLEHLAEFRAEFATQRLKYEKEVQSLVTEFAGVASEGQLEAMKKRILDIAKERVEETRKTYQRAKLEMVINTFGITLTPPALAASIASILGIGIFAPAGIAAALSVFAAKSLLSWNKAKSEKSKSPWSYVLDAAQIHQ
jgi:hypothetical protein